MTVLKPKDRAEEVALFRAEIVGGLARQDLARGELRSAFCALSQKRFRLPDSKKTRTLSIPTLERWYYRYRKGGLQALRPEPRSDRGHAHALTTEQRTLLCDIRREHPNASASLILRTLVADGRLQKDAISAATVRRFFVDEGLDRVPLRDAVSSKTRLRWQADRPGALWHADVCYGPNLVIDGQSRSVRVHALLDDASRFVVAIEACHTEMEMDMLHLLVRALRRYGAPDALYLDNGSTYRGQALQLCCERLSITLLHARPYDAPARGKMERFWRSLREGCLDHLGSIGSLHDINVRLCAYLDQHYHGAPHGGLLGRAPAIVWEEAERNPSVRPITHEQIQQAFTITERRRVRRDTTLSIAGQDFELDQGFLAGRVVTLTRCLIDPTVAPVVLHEDQRFPLRPVDPIHNAHRRRPPRRTHDKSPATPITPVPFDPPGALLERAAGRHPAHPKSRKEP